MFKKFQPKANLDRISQIAEHLAGEIATSGYRAGDAFPSAGELAERFSMSKSSANRILSQLVDRGLLERHRGRGNFISELGVGAKPASARSIYIVETAERISYAPNLVGRVYSWLSMNQPLGVQSMMLPLEAPMKALRVVIGGAWERGELECVVAVSCPREVYEFLLEAEIPALVIGSLYNDQQTLSSIDRDAKTEGALLASYLVDNGYRRIGTLLSASVRPGTHAFLDGVHEVLGRARDITMRVRPIPSVHSHILAVLRDLLLAEDRPDAILTESSDLAHLAASVARSLGIRIPADLAIVHSNSAVMVSQPSEFPHTHPTVSDTEFFELVQSAIGNIGKEPRRTVIPVELTVPPSPKGRKRKATGYSS